LNVEVDGCTVWTYRCMFLLYTLVLICAGFLAGQYTYDPVEQARREMHNWRAQAEGWRKKLNAWKQQYNKQHHLPYTDDPCPTCEECPPPRFCWHKPDIVCPAFECGGDKQDPYKDNASLLSELDFHTKMVAKVTDTLSSVSDTLKGVADKLNTNPQDGCPSCASQCEATLNLEYWKAQTNRLDCDTYGILQKLDHAERQHRETATLVPPLRPKVVHKARVHRMTYEHWKQCLALTMPPLYGAYMEILLARTLPRPPPPAPFPPRKP